MSDRKISDEIAAKLDLISMNPINPGVSHPLDRDRAIDTFREMKKAGVLPESFAIERWALSHGWDKDEAHSLKEIAHAIKEGRRVRKSL
jgi:hypothetical protein